MAVELLLILCVQCHEDTSDVLVIWCALSSHRFHVLYEIILGRLAINLLLIVKVNSVI